ncbi:MAG: phosphoribosylaminoimidazolesuccinocarboxamide synthase, partial [Bifidobacteriaceae bacterium]|nr:phosphoribosylaminoimidazolesuccinocarboxamide synthase [Bifidobacteriaceae bacterium]
DTAPDQILIVATDRISAFDYVLTTPIPDKGKVLTQLTLWWFDQLKDVVPNHLLSTDVPAPVQGRAMIAKKLDMLSVECIVRGYLTGSGLADYKRTGAVCGIELPAGLVDGSRLDPPIFTPSTKAELGAHDENVSIDVIAQTIGREHAEAVKELTLALYTKAERIARERGIILADTKFEFGLDPATGQVTLGDEVLTPDSSRFWDATAWEPGHAQASFDKQYVRDWLAHESGWDKASGTQPPDLPADVIERTTARYRECYQRLTGQELQ